MEVGNEHQGSYCFLLASETRCAFSLNHNVKNIFSDSFYCNPTGKFLVSNAATMLLLIIIEGNEILFIGLSLSYISKICI